MLGPGLLFRLVFAVVLLSLSSVSQAQNCSLSVTPPEGSFGTRLSIHLAGSCNFSAFDVLSMRATYASETGSDVVALSGLAKLNGNTTVAATLGRSSLTNSSRAATIELYGSANATNGTLLVKQANSFALYPGNRALDKTRTQSLQPLGLRSR